MDPKVIGIAAALGSAASWAVGSILFKRLGEQLSPLAMTLSKGAVSVVLLAAALVLTGFDGIQPGPLLLLVLSGLVGIALGDTFFFKALQDLGAHSLVVLLTLGQVFTVLLAVLWLGDRPSPTEWAGIASVVAGVAIVLQARLAGEVGTSGMKGVLYGLLAVLCMSVSVIIAKEGLAEMSTLQGTFIRMLAGMAGMLAFGLATGRLAGWMVPFGDRRLACHFVLAVAVVTFGGFWLSLVAVKYVDVSIANTLNSTEPLFVLPLAILFLKEKMNWRAVLGTLITLCGVIVICIGW